MIFRQNLILGNLDNILAIFFVLGLEHTVRICDFLYAIDDCFGLLYGFLQGFALSLYAESNFYIVFLIVDFVFNHIGEDGGFCLGVWEEGESDDESIQDTDPHLK